MFIRHSRDRKSLLNVGGSEFGHTVPIVIGGGARLAKHPNGWWMIIAAYSGVGRRNQLLPYCSCVAYCFRPCHLKYWLRQEPIVVILTQVIC